MGLHDPQNNKNQLVDSFIDRLESNIRHWPATLNKKLAKSQDTVSYLSSYLHFFDAAKRQENVLFEQCSELKAVYSRLNLALNHETFIGDWLTIDQDRIDEFARVTGDNQWIHTNPQRASKESPFKTTISQGFLTLALIPQLTNSLDPENTLYPEARMVVNYGLNNVAFLYPIKAGKRVRARSRLTQLVPMKRGLEIIREVTIDIENSSRPACIAETVIRLYF